MKRFILFSLIFCTLGFLSAKTAWCEVARPEIVSVFQHGDDMREMVVAFNLETGSDGADRARVICKDEQGCVLEEVKVGRSRKKEKSASFHPTRSGVYTLLVEAERKDEDTVIPSSPVRFTYSYPLAAPLLSVCNTGKGELLLSWKPVKEAESYRVYINDRFWGESTLCSLSHKQLQMGKTYAFRVESVRGSERVSSLVVNKTVRETEDRIWEFTYFGQSTNANLNTFRMIDSDNLSFALSSCSYLPDGKIDSKGGKYTAFHDGISYYYTTVDPEKENFSISATFTIDYINPYADGQEGFGLLAMDSLGSYGVSGVNHYTNSAGIIATKVEETIGGVKKTSKDTLGARFVTGLTPEVISGGDDAIAKRGKSVSHAYSYDGADLVKSGDVFTLTLTMDNTGYHAIYKRALPGEDTIEEYILYGKDELLRLDSEKVYVGFSVARGCNVTVSDVSFVVTDPRTDPPGQEEPPEMVPYLVKVDSPATYSSLSYPFVYQSNADGLLTLVNSSTENVVIKAARIKAGEDYTQMISLEKGINDFIINFTPDLSFIPAPHAVMAKYDKESGKYEENHDPIVTMNSVICLSYPGHELYVTPSGSPFGDGTISSPLDLASALAYCAPGQTVIVEEGTYYPAKLKIERGNSGFKGKTKKLQGKGTVVFDFSHSNGGMELWGDWWEIENLTICNTKGNVKGLQVAGDHNIIRQVIAHHCGDTGIQISGTSLEKRSSWPKDNLIISCLSHDNADPAGNNADGFAAKLTVSDGNVFESCIAYSNIDDGWDLFAKIETGPIGVVTIRNCVAYRNGSLSDGSGVGDGNGFKLGGDGIAVPHLLENSIAFANGMAGITSNSNPAVILKNVTSFKNGSYNIALYGKGDGERDFRAEGVVSLDAAEADNIREMPTLTDGNNYFFNGAVSQNSKGVRITPASFISIEERAPSLDKWGKINISGFLMLRPELAITAGARL